jgi:glucose-6-phosphate 1-dehydrogenase
MASLESCNFVVFGGTGDLALRKLLPALYYLERDGHLPAATKIVGAARQPLDDDAYAAMVEAGLVANTPKQHYEQSVWSTFKQRLAYIELDSALPDTFDRIRESLGDSFQQQRTIYYLSTPPDLYGEISTTLGSKGLVRGNSRIVLEKPIGTDLCSSVAINQTVATVFDQENIFRIDHYLGKETVQNLLALRFANTLFEPLWNSEHISNIQITVSETVGVERRWDYYNDSGALRDMVQNHMLQLLCLVAMGVPVSIDSESLRVEKLKVLRSMKVLTPEEVRANAVRAQYTPGVVNGTAEPGYREENDARPSDTETFVAIRAEIHNWRWRGVPFYLRTGKRLPARFSEVVIEFKDVPHSIFPASTHLVANKLVIRLQPEEGIQLFKMNKVPGLSAEVKLVPVSLNLILPDKLTETRPPDAHERLIYDVMRGDATLFVHQQEIEAAWKWCDAIRLGWAEQRVPLHTYTAGSWGPQAAYQLTAVDGNSWHEHD